MYFWAAGRKERGTGKERKGKEDEDVDTPFLNFTAALDFSLLPFNFFEATA